MTKRDTIIKIIACVVLVAGTIYFVASDDRDAEIRHRLDQAAMKRQIVDNERW